MPHRNRLPAYRFVHAHTLLTALAIASGSMSAHALTLGRFQVLSGMGEPLRAEVEISAANAEESQSLRVQIAAPRSFQQAGMEYHPALEGLTASIENRSGGRSFIVLQGRKPVQENFLDLILETQWSTGRLVRNYALLLNSVADKPQPAAPLTPARAAPTLSGAAPTTAVQPTEVPPARVEYNAQNVPVYRFDAADTSKPAAAPSPATPLTSAPATPAVAPAPPDWQAQSITVQAGQTASHLALAHMPASVSLDQMLVAMQRNNPEAFIQENVNLVREGAVLRMPSAEQAQQTSTKEARELVIVQNRAFAEYVRRIAQSPLQVAKGADREASGKVSADTQPAPDANAGQDKLTLSKSQIGKDSTEVKVAAEREAQDAAEQAAALKKNIDELSSLAPAASEASTAAIGAPAPPVLAEESSDSKPLWLWGTGLAALLGIFLWRRNRPTQKTETFAPSYDDEPLTSSLSPAPADAPQIPAQMAGIDLNLPTATAATSAPSAPSADEDTEIAKLELARVLMSKGDTAIARSLLQSVIDTGSGELKTRAQQLLSQFP